MGAGQAFQWATQFPDFMDVCVPYCGSAKTSEHNQVFLEGVKSALLSAKGTASAGICKGEIQVGGDYRGWTEEEKVAGLKALGRVYAGWGFSQPFYRHQVYRTAETLGFKDLEDFMVGFWETWALDKGKSNWSGSSSATITYHLSRPGKHACNAAHMASRRCVRSRAIQWGLRRSNGGHQSQYFGDAVQD